MKLRLRLPLFFSLIFSVMLAIVMLTVYYLFSNFRHDDFKTRLSQRADAMGKLLIEVQQVDSQLLRIIDEKTTNKIYNERVVIYNDSLRILYSSNDSASAFWNIEEIRSLKNKKEIFKTEGQYDLLGFYHEYNGDGYYILMSGEDKYGNRKLDYLKFLLLGAFWIGTLLVWLLSFYLSKKILRSLDLVRLQMQEITTKNLNVRLPEYENEDEIKALSHSFNRMLDRIDKAYKSQKDFTSNASHELRTPVARILMQLENLRNTNLDSSTKNSLKNIAEDVDQLADIISSLLLLSKIENSDETSAFKKIRIDELIFDTADQLKKMYPDFKMHFEIENAMDKEVSMEIKGDASLLKIALTNLFKNAYEYSDNKIVNCLVKPEEHELKIFITNTGGTPKVKDPSILFNTFTRGSNSQGKQGSGLGLSIVKRILDYHGATAQYHIIGDNTNQIVVTFLY